MCCGSSVSPRSTPPTPALNPLAPASETPPLIPLLLPSQTPPPAFKKIVVLTPSGPSSSKMFRQSVLYNIKSIFHGSANYQGYLDEEPFYSPSSVNEESSIFEPRRQQPKKDLTRLLFTKSDLSPPSAPQQVSVSIGAYSSISEQDPFSAVGDVLNQKEESPDWILCIGRKELEILPLKRGLEEHQKEWNTTFSKITLLSICSDKMLALDKKDQAKIQEIFFKTLRLSQPKKP